MEEIKQKFCRYCGRKCAQISQGAELFYYYYERGKFHPYTKYSRETGRRQIVVGWQCPSYEDKLFRRQKHDSYYIDKIREID